MNSIHFEQQPCQLYGNFSTTTIPSHAALVSSSNTSLTPGTVDDQMTLSTETQLLFAAAQHSAVLDTDIAPPKKAVQQESESAQTLK